MFPAVKETILTLELFKESFTMKQLVFIMLILTRPSNVMLVLWTLLEKEELAWMKLILVVLEVLVIKAQTRGSVGRLWVGTNLVTDGDGNEMKEGVVGAITLLTVAILPKRYCCIAKPVVTLKVFITTSWFVVAESI